MTCRLSTAGFMLIISFSISTELNAQSLFKSTLGSEDNYSLNGFIRSYGFISRGSEQTCHFTSSVSDISLQLDAGNSDNIQAFGEIRYSYGTLNDAAINNINLREAWIGFYPDRFSFEAGRKIIRWGRGDIFTPFSITPSDNLVRSPDSEDRMTGSMMIGSGYAISDRIAVSAIVIPLYMPSVIPFHVVDLPPSVIVEKNLRADKGESFFAGYGIRGNFSLYFTNISLYWFEGYDLLPVLYMTGFELSPPDPGPAFSMTLRERGFRTSMLSADAEGTFSGAVWRAALSHTIPDKSSGPEGYIPFDQTSWMAGVDINAGNSMVTLEYSGAFIHDWYRSPVAPGLPGGEISDDLTSLPAEEIPVLLTEQIIAFNRLYRYQTEKWNNMAGVNIKGSAAYGKLNYNASLVFNMTSSELLLRPTLEYIPYDRISLRIGFEYWWGKENSLYSYISDNLTSLVISARVNF